MRLSRRALLAAALLPGAALRAQTLNEARVKAKLALTLARFTAWPAESFSAPSDPLLLCVAHRNEAYAAAFGELAGQTVAGHPVKVVDTPGANAAACHVLFVHESAARGGSAALAAISALPVLTVGDSDGFATRGGMVELVNVNDAIRLDVNLRLLRAAQLDLSSRVLQLARQVHE